MAGFPSVVTALALLLAPDPTPGPPAAPTPRARPADAVPILMYHAIGAAPAGSAWPQLYVAPGEFAAQLDWLARHGFAPITLSQLWRGWFEGDRLPRRPIVLTFDDGHPSAVTEALPALARRRWPAVLNLKVGNLEPGFSVRDVRRFVAHGWELAAHTISHVDLTTLDDARLRREIDGSRAEIRRLFNVPVDFFCYPGGRYDRRVIAAVRRAGFVGATTTDEGLAAPGRPFRLSRVRVSGGDGVRRLATSLRARTAASPGSAPPAPGSGTHG